MINSCVACAWSDVALKPGFPTLTPRHGIKSVAGCGGPTPGCVCMHQSPVDAYTCGLAGILERVQLGKQLQGSSHSFLSRSKRHVQRWATTGSDQDLLLRSTQQLEDQNHLLPGLDDR